MPGSRLLKVGRSAAWGRVEEVRAPSPARQSPDCPHFPQCGGCALRHMSYAEELEFKRQKVEDALKRIGGLELPVAVIHGAPRPERYRNKAQFPVSDATQSGIRIGFFRARSHDVIDVPSCLLQRPEADAAGRAVKAWMEDFDVSAYDEKKHAGLVRHVYVRTNRSGESLICLLCNGRKLPHEEELVQALRAAVPKAVGVVLGVNQDKTNVILGKEYRTLWGQDFLYDTLCGLSFQLSVPSFFQVNPEQTEVLYQKAAEFAGLTGRETVVDLYCGTGTISLVLARQAGQVIGAEIVPSAVEDAKENARRNGITNAEFICADAGEAAAELSRRGLRPDVICVGPAPERDGRGGHRPHRRHGPRACGLCVLRSGHPGPGLQALRRAGLSGRPGRGGGYVSQDEACGDRRVSAQRTDRRQRRLRQKRRNARRNGKRRSWSGFRWNSPAERAYCSGKGEKYGVS